MAIKKGDIETNYEIRSFDLNISLEDYNKMPKHKLYFVLDNLRSAFNVGSIFRLADTMRIAELILCGYTAYPPHIKLEKTSLGTIKYVPWKHFDDIKDAIIYLKEKNIPIWAAETTSESKPYNKIDIPENVAVIFGNEALGIERETLEQCDEIIEIPTYGYKNSLNVATSVAVIGYHIIESRKNKQIDWLIKEI